MVGGGIGERDCPELEVLVEKPESREHTVALRSERTRVAAIGTSATFPEDACVRGDDPSEGATIRGSAVMCDVEGRRRRILEVRGEIMRVAM
jgi:hypothetical protein